MQLTSFAVDDGFHNLDGLRLHANDGLACGSVHQQACHGQLGRPRGASSPAAGGCSRAIQCAWKAKSPGDRADDQGRNTSVGRRSTVSTLSRMS